MAKGKRRLPMVERQCGTCTACCTALAVVAIEKPQDRTCVAVCSKGCGVYADRPKACRDFRCLWLQGHEAVVGEHRPDRCGLVLDVTRPRGGLPQAIIAHELWPGAASEGTGLELMMALQLRAVVVVRSGEQRRVVGPRGLVEPFLAAVKLAEELNQ